MKKKEQRRENYIVEKEAKQRRLEEIKGVKRGLEKRRFRGKKTRERRQEKAESREY